MHKVSAFHFYSLGIVAANKSLSSKDIEAVPIEHSSFANGELTDNASPVSTTAKDSKGAHYSAKTNTTASIKATWLPIGGSNRMTAPDVRRGETVMLYRFADTDEYHWTTCKDDMDLRKLETVIYAFSATTNEGASTGADTSYYLEVSTHNKMIHLHTSIANGEPYAYDIQLNAATGFIQIQDDQGNFINFNTPDHRISIVNQDASLIEVNKTNINLSCTDTITMTCANKVVNANSSITETSPNTTMNTVEVHNGHMDITGGLSTR